MSYTFNPLTDAEIDAMNLMSKGEYSFEVIKSSRKTSKSGNPMAELQLRVWDDKGVEHYVYDYLVFSNINLNIRKVKHFCESVGLIEEYKKGSIPEELDGKSGKVIIDIRDEQPKEGGGFYPKKNIVSDYVIGSPNIPKTETKEEFFSDHIPF